MTTSTLEDFSLLEQLEGLPGFSLTDRSHASLSLPWMPETEPRILLIEDDPHISLSLTIRLKNAGYHVLPAPNASDGLRFATDSTMLPDVILMDIMLPGVSGLAVAETLREQQITEAPVSNQVTGPTPINPHHPSDRWSKAETLDRTDT